MCFTGFLIPSPYPLPEGEGRKAGASRGKRGRKGGGLSRRGMEERRGPFPERKGGKVWGSPRERWWKSTGVLPEGAGGGSGSSPGGRWWKTWHPSRKRLWVFSLPAGNASRVCPSLRERLWLFALSFQEGRFYPLPPG